MKILFSLFLSSVLFAQSPKILESTAESITVEFSFGGKYLVKDTTLNGKTFQKIVGGELSFEENGKPVLPQEFVSLGVKSGSSLTYKIVSDQKQTLKNKFLFPYASSESSSLNSPTAYSETIYQSNQNYPSSAISIYPSYVYRFATIQPIGVFPFQFNPVTRELVFHEKIVVRFFYKNRNENSTTKRIVDKATDGFLKNSVLNYSVAKDWTAGKNMNTALAKKNDEYWYNPQFTWVKLYLKNEGIYRISPADLIAMDASLNQFSDIKKIKLFNNGEEVPLEIVDDGDSLFNNNDYIQFVGVPIAPSRYCKDNIYNTSNIYWLTINSDTDGKRYQVIDGYKSGWGKTFQQSKLTLHYEKDLLYEHFGYAENLERDYWHWGKASGINGKQTEAFSAPFVSFPNYFPDSNIVTVRANFHGLTNYASFDPDHRVKITLTGQLVDSVEWDGQSSYNFEKKINTKNINIFPENYFQVFTDGLIVANSTYPDQSRSDEIRINWFEFDYWRENRVNGNYFHLTSTPEMFGKNRFSLWNWTSDDMLVYIPQRKEVIKNTFFTQNQYREVLFVDSAYIPTDYYCTSLSNFLKIDSMELDTPSDLRNKTQVVDYLIITHKDFLPAAERLKQFRETNFPDTSIVSPRIQIVNINDIYDEFSFGLLDPYAVQSYIKYAFENYYTGTPLSYVVLIGDMSSDYRGIFPDSRKNFIPSMPYQSYEYGLAASDNMFVAVSGNDVAPDIAIGRLSCETLIEANNLVDKIITYPSDPGKIWKQNSLLVASGQDLNDELFFAFNDESLLLDKIYLAPNGFSSKKIFRYPSKPEHLPFKGEGADIRRGIDSGAVLVNYFGHGGGSQWDLVFLNDDIYMLNNGGKLPFICSVTCYTAHFDNQDVFGEKFIKIPGKGAIGFWGSAGLTSFSIGVALNSRFFNEVFNKKNYIVGKAILNAKNYNVLTGPFADQIALATLLGDPITELAFPKKPDYSVSEDLVSLTPEFPIVNSPVQVKISIKNFGFINPDDSLLVELSVIDKNVKNLIGSKKIKSFGLLDSVVFAWTPAQDGTNTLIVDVNANKNALEDDFSDNECIKSFYAFKTSEPNIISPVNGFISTKKNVEFLIADIGEYVDKKLTYQIQIDTSVSFEKPLLDIKNISPSNGVVKWTTTLADSGIYFWRTRSWVGLDSSIWTNTSTFSITTSATDTSSFSGKQLKLLESENIYYSDSLKGLTLNATFLPAKPTNNKYLGKFPAILPDSIDGWTAITTDGKYLYAGAMAYYNGNNSKIYKIGTGNYGTYPGQNYGAISTVSFPIFHTIFYYNDKIYVATQSSKYLTQVDLQSGDTSSVLIPGSMINQDSFEKDGGFFLTSDGRYVYNLSVDDSTGAKKYRLRILDPQNNWTKVGEDRDLSGTSYNYFSSFFVIDNYLYATEYGDANYMRRFDLTTNRFEEEWLVYTPYQGYFSWTYDQKANVLYASSRPGYTPRISKFVGKYKNTEGTVETFAFGPAKKWNSVSYDIELNNPGASANVQLQKYNKTFQRWDLVKENLPSPYLLDTLTLPVNSVLRLSINLKDTSTVPGNLIKFRKLGWNYTSPTELAISKNGLHFDADSLLQGFPLEFQLTPENLSSTPSDTFQVACYLDDAKLPFFSSKTELKGDSSVTYTSLLETSKIGDLHKIRVELTPNESEKFSFNNFIEKKFFIRYDTLRPTLQVLIDGKEILDGDIVSKEPEIEVSLKDNSPLPISKNNFSISVDNIPLDVTNIRDSIVPYPNNQTILKWKEVSLKEGEHFLDGFAKDSSGNYFDASVHRITFFTYTVDDIKYVYNYPNPFITQTHFTFELRGERKPEEITIRIFTIAGRLIKEIKPSSGDFSVGFNKIFWDGKDQDGDPIANGLYLYKVIAKFNDKTITTTQKLVKME
ncbi:MAG: C25 family cysteine peptidase [Ignavibacteriaceae bacterium]